VRLVIGSLVLSSVALIAQIGGPMFPGPGMTSVPITTHVYWRVLFIQGGSDGGSEVAIGSLQMFNASGTSLASGGTPSASSTFSGLPASNAFDTDATTAWNCGGSALATADQWLQYQFSSPVNVSLVMIQPWATVANKNPTNLKVQYSDNGSSWIDATTAKTPAWPATVSDSRAVSIPVSSQVAGTYANWRLLNAGTAARAVAELILRTTTGGSQVAAAGISSASSVFSSTFLSSKAFDADSTTFWSASGNGGGQFLEYSLIVPKRVSEIVIQARNDSSFTQAFDNFQVQGSNDGGTWTTINTFSPTWTSAGQSQTFTVQ
jgi:hypothetical protein